MEYPKGYVYQLMDNGGPTDVREPYFKEAVDEMMRARKLCAIANAKMPDDESYVTDLEERFVSSSTLKLTIPEQRTEILPANANTSTFGFAFNSL